MVRFICKYKCICMYMTSIHLQVQKKRICVCTYSVTWLFRVTSSIQIEVNLRQRLFYFPSQEENIVQFVKQDMLTEAA